MLPPYPLHVSRSPHLQKQGQKDGAVASSSPPPPLPAAASLHGDGSPAQRTPRSAERHKRAPCAASDETIVAGSVLFTTMREALVLVFLGCPHRVLAMTSCKPEEYPVGDNCCPKCRPGYHVKEACRGSRPTLCVPCTGGTFTAHLNGLDECLQCRACDPDMGLVIRQKCSSTANTVCGCARGRFCVSHDADQCVECRPHSVCRPGQRVRATGTEHQDVVCEDCPPGTFSPNGTLAECQPWTQCSQVFQRQEKPGTNSVDATCSSWAPWLFLLLLFPVSAAVLVFVRKRLRGGSTRKQWLSQGNRQQADGSAAEVQILGLTPVLPDVTTVAVQETESLFPKRDPTADQWPQGAAT